MKRVYVTESGYIDKYGIFFSTGVIGVDSLPRSAVSYIMDCHCYRYNVDSRIDGIVIIYKEFGSCYGFRLSVLDLF